MLMTLSGRAWRRSIRGSPYRDYSRTEMSEYDSNYVYRLARIYAALAHHGRPRHEHFDPA